MNRAGEQLRGVRVLDLGIWRPVPYATQLLAELGADVTKVEPPGGDPMRVFGPLHETLNGAKRAIELDLKTDDGRAQLAGMMRDADVVIEGFRPGVAARLGAGFEDALAANPRVIYCSISGFGQDGPLAAASGHDLNYQAWSGVLAARAPEVHTVRDPRRRPRRRRVRRHGHLCRAGPPGSRRCRAVRGRADRREHGRRPRDVGGTRRRGRAHRGRVPRRQLPRVRDVRLPRRVGHPRHRHRGPVLASALRRARTRRRRRPRRGRRALAAPSCGRWSRPRSSIETRDDVVATLLAAGVPIAPVLSREEAIAHEHFIDPGHDRRRPGRPSRAVRSTGSPRPRHTLRSAAHEHLGDDGTAGSPRARRSPGPDGSGRRDGRGGGRLLRGRVRFLAAHRGADHPARDGDGARPSAGQRGADGRPHLDHDRDRARRPLLARVRAVRGVAQANPNYDQPVAFVVRPGTQTERPPVLRGVVLATTSEESRWTLRAGRWPGGAREVAVDAGGAVVAGAAVGGSARLKFPIGTIRVRVVGLVAAAGSGPTTADPPRSETQVALASAHVLLDPDVAPIVLDAQGRADRITVTPLPGVDPDVLASRLRDAVPSGIAVLAATSRAAQTQQTIAAIDGDVRAATLGYAGLTMLVAILVIANSYSVLVAQRTRELGLLRLIGASRAQLMRTVLGESMVVGLAGALIGGAIGVVLAYVASRIVRTAGVSVGVSLTWGMAVVAVAVGVSTSVVGASWPAWRAGRVAPIEALSDTSGGADRPSRGVVPAVMALVGFAVATWARDPPGDLDAIRLAAIGAGVVSGFAGLALLSRWIVVPFSTVVSWPLRRVAGVTARLGVGNTTRQPSRTAGAASTLMVGLALVSIVGTFGASARQAIDAQVGAAGHADLYVQRTGVVRVSTTAVERTLGGVRRIGGDLVLVTAVDGVLEGRAARPLPWWRRTRRGGEDRRPGCGGRRPRRPTHVGASVAPLPPAMVSTDAATALGVGIGDRVTLRSVSGGSRPLTVAATYTDTAIVGPAVVPLTTAREVSADDTFDVGGAPICRQVSRPTGREPWSSGPCASSPGSPSTPRRGSPPSRRRCSTRRCGSSSCCSWGRSGSVCSGWRRRSPSPRSSGGASW